MTNGNVVTLDREPSAISLRDKLSGACRGVPVAHEPGRER